MAINAKRIQEILDRYSGLPDPQRQVFVVHDIEYLLANPKTKFGLQRSIGIALDDQLVSSHRPELSHEERARYLADKMRSCGLNPELDDAELAREVRRHIQNAKTGGWK